MKKAYIASTFFDGERFLENQAVLIEHERIRGLVAATTVPTDYEVVDLPSGILAPGFIDWQVNGGGGVLFNNDTNENALKRITQAHHKGGTTALFPTVVSDTQEKRTQAVEAVRCSMSNGNKSVLGIHLEGPFFSELKRGVHRQEYLRSLSNEDVDWLCSLSDLPVLLTLAPEQTVEGQIRALVDRGIIVSAGHSDAYASEVKRALSEGLSGFTHLYNAMRAADSREPGVVGCALTDHSSWCGLIVDGYHVHPDMIRLAYAAKPQGKLCLVTDAMATVGSDNKSFELYGNIITERNGHLVNHEGRLAGSAISMMDAVRNCHQLVDIELAECLRMAARYPAEFLGVATELGQIKPGYRADMVLFDSDFTVLQTWVAGQAML